MAMVETITEGKAALDRCGDLFDSDPIGCNLVASSLRTDQECDLLRIHDQGQTVGVAVRWNDGYTLSPLSGGTEHLLADELPTSDNLRLMGSPGDTASVAGYWSERVGGAIETVELFRVYRLAELSSSDAAGQVAVLRSEHVEQSAEWMVDFGTATGLTSTTEAARAQVERSISEGRLFGWIVGGELVSQLGCSVERCGVVRIGGVFTPDERQGRGYASALTAAVSRAQQAKPEVDEVTLNTQASNPSTNRLYRRLGFESVAELLVVVLRTTD